MATLGLVAVAVAALVSCVVVALPAYCLAAALLGHAAGVVAAAGVGVTAGVVLVEAHLGGDDDE